jgi:uncharacterized membrane protein YeaQ/YmgE (transglycosylase-associated protein family)
VGILAWVLFGLVVGALARLVTPGKAPSGCGLGGEGVTGFNLWSFLVAGLGAVILLVIYGAIAGRRQAR